MDKKGAKKQLTFAPKPTIIYVVIFKGYDEEV